MPETQGCRAGRAPWAAGTGLGRVLGSARSSCRVQGCATCPSAAWLGTGQPEVLRGYSGGTHVCRRRRGGPARRGRNCCHSGTHVLPGSPSGCAGDTWHTAGPQGPICKIPAGRLRREGHRSEGCAWMRIIPRLRGSHQHKAGPCLHVVQGKPAFLPCT